MWSALRNPGGRGRHDESTSMHTLTVASDAEAATRISSRCAASSIMSVTRSSSTGSAHSARNAPPSTVGYPTTTSSIPGSFAVGVASQIASGKVYAKTPANCECRSASSSAQRTRSDLLATRTVHPPARRAMSRRLLSNAARSMTASGGSRSRVASFSRARVACESQVIAHPP